MFTQEPSPPQPSAGRLFTGNGSFCARFARFTRVFPVISPEVAAQGGVSPAPSPAPTITDQPSATSPAEESFQTVPPGLRQTAANAQVLRGVSFTPGTGAAH